VPVVCIVSLSRKCEERHDRRPMLSDLRESGNWEYDADDVIFIYRDEVYNSEAVPNLAELIVAKHRGGKTGMVSSYFKKHLTTFIDLEVRQVNL
jgi:replicative DNA helicase